MFKIPPNYTLTLLLKHDFMIQMKVVKSCYTGDLNLLIAHICMFQVNQLTE